MVKKSSNMGFSRGSHAHTVAAQMHDRQKSHLRRQLDAYIMQHRLTPSEFARKVDLPRDHIHRYLREKSLPGTDALAKLARGMKCKPEDLVPDLPMVEIDPEQPTVDIVTAPDHPGKVWLRVDQLVERPLAAKIMQMLHDAATD